MAEGSNFSPPSCQAGRKRRRETRTLRPRSRRLNNEPRARCQLGVEIVSEIWREERAQMSHCGEWELSTGPRCLLFGAKTSRYRDVEYSSYIFSIQKGAHTRAWTHCEVGCRTFHVLVNNDIFPYWVIKGYKIIHNDITRLLLHIMRLCCMRTFISYKSITNTIFHVLYNRLVHFLVRENFIV